MADTTVILSGARTPIGKLGGALSSLSAPQLGAVAIRAAVDRAGIADTDVEQVIMGEVIQAGVGMGPARQAAVFAGLPLNIPAETLNKVCASGMRAVAVADQMIRSGDVRVVVAGGMESMSNAPYLVKQARFGYRLGDGQLQDAMVLDGLTDAFYHVLMAVHNSNFAEAVGLSREEQDAWALRSHRRAIAAIDEGRFRDEIVPVEVVGKKGQVTVVTTDEPPRRDTSMEALAKLPPVFKEDGTTTAGNAPGVVDGAAALVVASEDFVRERGLKPKARILRWATVAGDSRDITTLPAVAARKALKLRGLEPPDVDLWAINEAFAAVAIISARMLEIDTERVNVNGGSVALGHPIGATGARILVSLMYELNRRGGGLGVATMCSGGAHGDAIVLEVPSRD